MRRNSSRGHGSAPPFTGLVALHILGLRVCTRDGCTDIHERATHDALRELLREERQPHLRLKRVVVEEDATSDAVVGGLVVEAIPLQRNY